MAACWNHGNKENHDSDVTEDSNPSPSAKRCQHSGQKQWATRIAKARDLSLLKFWLSRSNPTTKKHKYDSKGEARNGSLESIIQSRKCMHRRTILAHLIPSV
jgi:hypothetical protein